METEQRKTRERIGVGERMKKYFTTITLLLITNCTYAGEGQIITNKMNHLWGITRPLGWAILVCAFIWSLIQETQKIQDGGTPAYGKVLWELVLTAVVLASVHGALFPLIVNTCNAIGETARSKVKWTDFETMLGKYMQEGGFLAFFKLTFINVFVNFFTLIAESMEHILMGVRNAILSVLYVVAPVTVACAAAKETRGIFKGWLLGLLQISFWVVILRIVQSVAMNFYYASIIPGSDDKIPIISTSIGYIIMVVVTPLLTGKLLSGENIAAVGSIAVGAITGVASVLNIAQIGMTARAGWQFAGTLAKTGNLKKAIDTYRTYRDGKHYTPVREKEERRR